MRVKHLNEIPLTIAKSQRRTRNPLADIPIPPPERRRPAIERIRHRRALHNREAAQDGEPGAEGPSVVELAVGQHLAGEAAEGLVVGLDEELLEADDVRRGLLGGEDVGDLEDALGAEGGDVEEAPAVEGEDGEVVWEVVVVVVLFGRGHGDVVGDRR